MEITNIPNRQVFLDRICYTTLVFGRFNKKLTLNLTNDEIKKLVNQIIISDETVTTKEGKNYYLRKDDIELVINSYNFRLITANRKKS